MQWNLRGKKFMLRESQREKIMQKEAPVWLFRCLLKIKLFVHPHPTNDANIGLSLCDQKSNMYRHARQSLRKSYFLKINIS